MWKILYSKATFSYAYVVTSCGAVLILKYKSGNSCLNCSSVSDLLSETVKKCSLPEERQKDLDREESDVT